MRVPRRLQELSAKVNQATDTLTTQFQRSPTIQEIADYLDVSVDEVLEAMESSSAYSSRSARGHGQLLRMTMPLSVIDRYGNEDNELAFTDDRLVIEEALKGFSPREREVIELRFLKGMTQIESPSSSASPRCRFLVCFVAPVEDPGEDRPRWRDGAATMTNRLTSTRKRRRASRRWAIALRVWSVVGAIIIGVAVLNATGCPRPGDRVPCGGLAHRVHRVADCERP